MYNFTNIQTTNRNSSDLNYSFLGFLLITLLIETYAVEQNIYLEFSKYLKKNKGLIKRLKKIKNLRE